MKAIKRPLKIAQRRLCRPTVANLPNLTSRLKLLQPHQRLIVIQPSSLRDTRRRVLPTRQLTKRLLQSILTLLRLTTRLRRCLRLRNRRLHDLPRDTRRGRLSMSSPTRRTHHHRLTTLLTENLKATPPTSRPTNPTTAPGTFNLDQIFVIQSHPIPR